MTNEQRDKINQREDLIIVGCLAFVAGFFFCAFCVN